MKRLLGICVFSALISACSPMVWHKPGASDTDFGRDKYTCMQESQQRVSNAQVNAYGGASENKVITNSSLYNSCMNSKGWTLQSKESAQRISQQQIYQQNTVREQQKQKVDSAKETLRSLQKESTEFCSKQEYAIIYKKSSCKTTDLTLDQLSDQSKISQSERPAFLQIHTETQSRSKKATAAFRYPGDPTGQKLALLNEKYEALSEQNALDLYEGKISWGEYNKTRKSYSKSFKDEYNEIARKKIN